MTFRAASVTMSSTQEVTVSTQPLVLVADDEPRITKLVSIALGEEGFRVVTAGSGEEALAKAEEVRPDIVLLDIVMPDLDGIEVMRQLRERRPVAVILLTAKGSTADKAKGLDLGADDYIAKPFHPDELAARVRAVLRRSSGAQPGSGVLKFDDVEIDLERRMVTRERRAGPAVADRMAAPPAPRRECRQGRPPHRAADQGLGPGVPRRPAVPARLGLARPAQARRGARRAGPDQDVPGDRLPARRRAAGPADDSPEPVVDARPR